MKKTKKKSLKKKKSEGRNIITTVGLGALLIAISLLVIKSQQRNTLPIPDSFPNPFPTAAKAFVTPTSLPIAPSPSITPVVLPCNAMPHADWKTYTASGNTFSFQYPSSWYYTSNYSPGAGHANVVFYQEGTSPHESAADYPGNDLLWVNISNDQDSLETQLMLHNNNVPDIGKEALVSICGRKFITYKQQTFIFKTATKKTAGIISVFDRVDQYMPTIIQSLTTNK